MKRNEPSVLLSDTSSVTKMSLRTGGAPRAHSVFHRFSTWTGLSLMLIRECLCFQGTPAPFFPGGWKNKFLVIYTGTKTTHKYAKSDQNKMSGGESGGLFNYWFLTITITCTDSINPNYSVQILWHCKATLPSSQLFFLLSVQTYVGDPKALLLAGVGPAFRGLPHTEGDPGWGARPRERADPSPPEQKPQHSTGAGHTEVWPPNPWGSHNFQMIISHYPL